MANVAELLFGSKPELEEFDPLDSPILNFIHREDEDLKIHVARDKALFGHLMKHQIDMRNMINAGLFIQQRTNKILLLIVFVLVANGLISLDKIVASVTAAFHLISK